VSISWAFYQSQGGLFAQRQWVRIVWNDG
jgi:hypothetical protein